ncbi:hypothetical protein ABZ490_10460 [Streptomyces sp. NPDC005811]|uniref:hypothetical protein n=1 Tax=Streptomyces sp. NPDC005811 TaxID=3154565 RepID=UPI00340BB1C6
MRAFSRHTRTRLLGSVVTVTSLALVVPAAAVGTAHANPASSRVKVTGTASCDRFEDASPTTVTITPKGKTAKSDDLPGEDSTETYAITFTGIPKSKGLPANAKVTCTDSDGDTFTYGKSFTITRPPAANTEVQTLNLK